ncbi:PIN domain-like protein [Armillaria luteobubalina]|uniref:PIN domain-like protein n=1 Tax=Armillaria luteobubalina TaxID=153913 RepID=A0AA39NT23_9AGAR|nr:PIN domain-like protein [Armillaria luteobubalina]
MGAPGLWDILNKAAQPRAISHLAVVDGFERNSFGRIWYQHSLTSKSAGDTGGNPELRMLFFRLHRLAESPLVPLFVFDGRERPKIKRKRKMGKSGSHQLSQGMKELLRLFGMQWIAAKGEAEAELARLNRLGIIDAVMTDDVDMHGTRFYVPPLWHIATLQRHCLFSNSTLISAPSQASSTMIPRTIESNYDLTFAGGVTAACIIAGCLSKADPNLKILILAGPITKDKSEHVQPSQYIIHLAPTSKTIQFYESKPSEHVAGRAVVVPSGRCIGGDRLTNVALH